MKMKFRKEKKGKKKLRDQNGEKDPPDWPPRNPEGVAVHPPLKKKKKEKQNPKSE